MNCKRKYAKLLTGICSCIIFCCLAVSACSSDNISEIDGSVAMVKNSTMMTYGTGFAVGTPGKAVDTIITSYSIVATQNGAIPQTAEVIIDGSGKKLSANVIFCDAGRNVAVLKLPESSKQIKPLVLKDTVNYNEAVYVRGYDGTGNIMSDFDKFNTTDIIQYSGNISAYDEINTMKVYKYSNEFNRALVGAPALDEKGNAVGMCAYSLNSMNTYSQYILSSEELIKLLSVQKIEFITSEEVKYKNIIILSGIIGLSAFIAIIILAVITVKKIGNSPALRDKYIRITDGTLKGKVYKLDGKLTVGRDGTKCDIVYPVDEPGISAVHCTVQIESDAYYLIDNFSKYGTFLEDGTKITASVPYKIEDEKFTFYIAKPQNRFELTDEKEIKR